MADCSPIYNPTPVETYLNRILGLPPKNARPKKIVKIDNNNTTATTTSVDDDGSAGYGSTKLDSSIYTRDTAPEKIKQKFHYYFNKFPPDLAGQLQMDEIASFSVTEATFADQISEIIASQNGVHNQMHIVDATSCVGGNSMSFGKYFQHLTAVELDPKRAKMLDHNLDLCKQHQTFGFVANKRVFCGDYTKLMKTDIGRSDIVFFDPPWGGMDYKNEKTVELSLGNRKMHDIVNDCSQYAKYIVLKLPKNYNMVALKQGIVTGQIIYADDLSNERGVVKMKLVIVVCRQQQQQQQHQGGMMMIPERQNNGPMNHGNLIKLIDSRIPVIKTWKDALNSIVGGKTVFARSILPRGLYSKGDDQSKAWTHIMETFPNGVPCFRTNEECIEFCKTLGGIPTNPQFPHLQHVYTTLIGWNQVVLLMHKKMREYRIRYPLNNSSIGKKRNRMGKNRFNVHDTPRVYEEVDDRCKLPFYKRINPESTMNSLLYMFFHMRCGIYIMIRNKELQMFVPFVNDEYRNTFSHLLQMDSEDGSMEKYYNEKWNKNYCGRENIIPDKTHWWANANILCNQHQGIEETHTNYWGDHHLCAIRDMFVAACKERDMPDMEFFLNKRDHPQLKRDLTEPYDFIFLNEKGDKPPPLTRTKFKSYAPIFSYYVGKKFADFGIPLSDDWASATGLVFPDTLMKKGKKVRGGTDLYSEENFRKFIKPWGKKVPTAFFRGNLTGGGIDKETNQRINLITLAHECEGKKKYNGGKNGYPYLDAKGTGWNVRDKKLTYSRKVTYPRHDNFSFVSGRVNFVPIYKQTEYKYIIYVDGHSAANRYGFLMRLGCVILRVKSLDTCAGNEMWFYPLLKEFDTSSSSSTKIQVADANKPDTILEAPDHLLIHSDLSNLMETIEWCRKNDDLCQIIAQNSIVKHDHYMGREGILDYIEFTFNRLSNNTERMPWWYTRPKNPVPVPHIDSQTGETTFVFGKNSEEKWCVR